MFYAILTCSSPLCQVVGCAISCEKKAEFIQSLLTLEPRSQSFLQGMVQRAMQRAVLKDDEDRGDGDKIIAPESGVNHDRITPSLSANQGNLKDGFDELIQCREMNKHLQEERDKLTYELDDARKANIDLHSELQKLNEKISTYVAGRRS